MLKYVKRTLVLSLLAGAACKATPPTNFYVLTSLADADAPAAESTERAEKGALIEVGPVELPSYLDQAAIVTRASTNTLAMATFDHWAEPLQDGVARVLAEDLAHLRPDARIAVFPWKRAGPVDVQVIVRAHRFEVASDEARLAVEWRLVSGDGVEILSRGSSFTEPVSGGGYGAKVAAMSGVLGALSKEIAAAIAE